jgi:hypothetical protein
MDCIQCTIVSNGGRKLIIKTAPFCYETDSSSLLTQCYISTGFEEIQACTNTFIPVSCRNFEHLIKPVERRKLCKARRSRFTAELANDLSSTFVYDFLNQCRMQQGYHVSLTLCQIETLRTSFSDHFSVFVVRDNLKVIALTLTVRVNSRVLYNFLCADLSEYRVYSPVVLLTECVYTFCQQQQIEILDLGISLDQQGNFKPSLHRFKRNIGGQDCLKVTYEMDFPDQIPKQFPSL